MITSMIIFLYIVPIILNSFTINGEVFQNSIQETHTNNSGRIVGGEDADITDFPFIVSLEDNNGIHECGGTVLSADIVITAAHCFDGITNPASAFHVRGGTTRKGSGGYVAYVKEVIIHKDYEPIWLEFDVALLKLDRKFPLNTSVMRAAALPKSSEYVEEPARALVAGWGFIDNNETPTYVLQQITLPVINEDRCRRAYDLQHLIVPSMLCAGYTQILDKDICNHDSGSPLVLTDKKNVLQGIASWGAPKGCGRGYPAVFARVTRIREWIRDQVGL